MRCDATQETFLHHDGLLAERQRVVEAVEHLKGCPACQAALDDYAGLAKLLAPPQAVEAPADGWPAFQNRLHASASAARSAGKVLIGWGPAFAIAASIALLATSIIGTSYLNERARTSPTAAQITSASLAQFSPAQIPQQVETFAKVSEAFDNRASWMLISDHTSDVGVAQTAVPERSLVLLRLTLLHAGTIVSHADLVLIPGQQADLSLPSSDGKMLHYRVSASQAAPLSLGLWLGIENAHAASETIAALSTQLPLASGQVVSAGQLATVSGTYELKVGFVRAHADSIGTQGTPANRGRSQ